MRVLAASFVLALLAACSGGTPPETAKTEAAPEARQPTVFDEQLKALEKAKAVEAQMQEDKERRDREIEEQGG